MASLNAEADDFSLELFTGDDCNFSDLESDPDPIPKSVPKDDRLIDAEPEEGFNETDENLTNTSPENVEPTIDIVNTASTTTVTNSTERALRLERLEELAKKKRRTAPSRSIKTLNEYKESKVELANYLKQFRIPKVETSSYPSSYSSLVSSVETPKEKKNSYEGDKRNIWMIRLPAEEENPAWSKDNPPDPSSVFYAEYVKSQINGDYEMSDSDKTPSLPATPKCSETIFFDSDYEAHMAYDASNLKVENNNVESDLICKVELKETKVEESNSTELTLPLSSIQKYDHPHGIDSNIISEKIASTLVSKRAVLAKSEIENKVDMKDTSRLPPKREDLYDTDLLIDQTFDKENFKNGVCVIKPKEEDLLEILMNYRKLSELELNLNIKTNNLSGTKRQFSLLLDTCTILKYAGIIKRMLILPSFSIIIPDLVLKETRTIIEQKSISNSAILEVIDELERCSSIQLQEDQVTRSKNPVLRAEYIISLANKFNKYQIFSEDSVLSNLSKERKLNIVSKKYVEIITRKEEICNHVPEMNDLAIFIELKCQIRELLEAVMISEMEVFYKDQWTNIVKIKPASEGKLYWNLSTLLHLFELHFQAVFKAYFQFLGKTLEDSLQSIRQVLQCNKSIKEKIDTLIPLSFTLCHEVGWRGQLPVSSWLHLSSLQIASHLKGFTKVLSARRNKEAVEEDYEIDPDQVV